MYLATRYLAFVDMTAILIYLFRNNLRPQTCHTVYAISTYFTFSGIVLAEIILALRTYAMWKRSRIILTVLVVVNLGMHIPDAWITHTSVNALKFSPSEVPTLVPCLPTVPKTKEFIPFVNLMILEALVTVLAVLSAVKHWRHSNSPLIKTLYRDGVLYFVCLLSISSVNVVIFSVQSLNIYYDLVVELQRVLHGILSARIILNMRRVASDSLAPGWLDLNIGRSNHSSGVTPVHTQRSDIDIQMDIFKSPGN